ncbi:MAG: phenylalanine--tRNA ligase subunit alpha [Candidatus Omnitrophota bacterium]|nr:MAG: phenylalanine--tRNA ligase subunit alpha [Candidatus Omnitrophota bacterium]RKY35803.1 MAG: phenylalanine--tRNA ligase subunit alpha [Candidatus Omnitrophota bacterium]RKY44657.1 MAG: phenylalanine--tRNA ligase subunit alpha [Candidatus Omnitrophota bacterium]
MQEELQKLKQTAEIDFRKAQTLEELEALKVKFLGRNSFLAQFSKKIPSLEPSLRPQAGRLLNEAKSFITALWQERKEELSLQQNKIDLTFPSYSLRKAKLNPLTLVIREICSIFERIGFEIQEGREIEDEWHNFTALNIPLEHPSRDAFDTFYLKIPSKKYKYLLRSHTSPSQIRLMKKRKPPLAFVVPGRVYRPDNMDASHSFMFHQIEGFAVDKDINFSHLKGALVYFAQNLFSSEVKLRFRPHFFPFTEPSAEVDISCFICKGKGCSVCKKSGWLEILGCGMIHPRVLSSCGISPKRYQGFAFGMGVERIAMLKYRINDIRLFFENDLRFLGQFYEV